MVSLLIYSEDLIIMIQKKHDSQCLHIFLKASDLLQKHFCYFCCLKVSTHPNSYCKVKVV